MPLGMAAIHGFRFNVQFFLRKNPSPAGLGEALLIVLLARRDLTMQVGSSDGTPLPSHRKEQRERKG